MRLYKILKSPVVTEKTSNLELKQNTYVFNVSRDATKIDVKKAILNFYGVEVESVNILNTREKFKYGKKRGMQIKRKIEKKAYIKLKDSEGKIDFSIIK